MCGDAVVDGSRGGGLRGNDIDASSSAAAIEICEGRPEQREHTEMR